MGETEPSPRRPPARVEGRAGRLWGIVLAGGEGVRLRPLARRICGDDRPKQYVPLLGSQTLLGQTLDRVAPLIPPERIVLVTVRAHARYVAAEFSGRRPPHLLVQPDDRGTAAGILFPTHWISRRDPEATVAVFPSDHFVAGEATFMGHVAEVAEWLDRHREHLVVLGARPSAPEVEYGWVEPGEPLDRSGEICRVRRFWEKPAEETAQACLQASCLWNTFVLVAKIAILLRAGREYLPAVSDRLARLAAFLGTEDEEWAVQQAYALMPKANFSRSVLEACPPFLAVSRLPGVIWSDLGTPRRVLEVLRRERVPPSWLREGERPA